MEYMPLCEYYSWIRNNGHRNEDASGTKQNNLITVDGVGKVTAAPDIAAINISVISDGKELKKVQQQNALQAQAVINNLKKNGIAEKDIKTAAYNVSPQYDYVEGKQIPRGYRVINNLRVIIRDLSKTGEIIDSAVEAGANEIGNIDFMLEENSKQYNLALRKAINNAAEKANTIGQAIGVNVERIPISVVEEGYNEPVIREQYNVKAFATTTPVKPGEIEITATVKVIFRYH